MVISLKRHYATEKYSLKDCLERYAAVKESTDRLLSGINRLFKLNNDSKILEIGAAQGALLIACDALGYSYQGIEPYEPAIEISRELSKQLDTEIKIKKGFGENLPCKDNKSQYCPS